MSVALSRFPLGEQPGPQLLSGARAAIGPVLRSAVDSLRQPLNRMGGYHFGWCDSAGMPAMGSTGKALRPALVFAAAVACGGDPGQARHAGAAVELVHNFSLIHDDVMDRDELRHGRATVWQRWGETNAIVLGDALHALALAVLVDGVPDQVAAEAVMRLEIATINLCGGQYRDCAFETSPPVDLTEYLAMVEGKTGALLGVSCALGALCAGADHTRVSQMYTFGCQLGVAFQIIDDALGIWGDPQLTGKPAGNDLLRYKQTYPVVFAMTSNTESGRSLAGMYASLELSEPASVAQATRLIERTGGRTATEYQALHHITAAFKALPPDLMTGDLEALARLVTSRKW